MAAPSGFCIDPIEKKPLNHFLPGTPVLSFGTSRLQPGAASSARTGTSPKRGILIAFKMQPRPRRSQKRPCEAGCRSVAFTYNDPVIFLEYAIDVAQACRERGIKTVAVSAGYISPEPRIEFFRHMDAANIDLKGFIRGFL